MTPAEEILATKRWNYLGFGLIGIAFIGPSLGTLAGFGNAFSVGEDIARTFGSLAFAALIAWFIVRKKSDLSKAKARVVVGLLLCTTVGTSIVNAAREKEQAQEFVRQSLAFQAKHSAKFDNLARRFDEVTVDQYLSPEGLVSIANIAAGKAALERYRLLLQERNLLLQTYLSEYAAFVGKLPAGRLRDGAESKLGPNKEATENLFKMLDRVQSERASAIGALFDWAQANSGKITIRNGQLMYSDVEQQQQAQTLGKRLQQAENDVNAAVEKARSAQVASEEKMKQLHKDASDFLAK